MCSHLLADVQDVCDRIAILHQGELKELGRVDSLLHGARRDADSGLRPDDEAKEEIRDVIERHHGTAEVDGQSDDDAGRAVPVDRPRQRSPAGPHGPQE